LKSVIAAWPSCLAAGVIVVIAREGGRSGDRKNSIGAQQRINR
jgi:hypothetical protein